MKTTPKQLNNAWLDPQSFIKEEVDENGRLIVRGLLYHHGAEFRFSVTQQNAGGAAMRGSVSAISPTDGHIMQVTGSEKADILQRLKSKKPDYISKMEGKRIPELNMTRSVRINSLDIEQIKEGIYCAILQIYQNHASQIHRALGEVVRPETITPSIAAHKYVDKYMEKNHSNLQARSFATYRDNILSVCAELPNNPMRDFKVSTLQAYFETTNLSQHKKNLLRSFWQYCLDANVCVGNLPFPPEQKKKLSVNKAVLNAVRPDILSLNEQDKFYNLISNNPNGPDCGSALQLWGGYSPTTACTFNWGDVIWDEYDADYVRIRYFIHDLVGATHDYTAPLFPAGALILRKRYQKLLEQYTEKDLAKMPIVSQIKDPHARLGANALVQHTKMRLHTIGLTYEAFALLRKANPDIAVSRLLLKNTYANNVSVLCSLQDEPGTVKFLLHESLSNNTSDDHYTCFSDEEAGKRLHTITSCVIPEQLIGIESDDAAELLPNGKEQHTFTPEKTRQRVGHVGQYNLKPGEELIIKCPHGVTGSASVRAVKADGNLRRKTPKK